MKTSDFVLQGVTGWKSAQKERVNQEKLVAVAGTQVTCPRCQDVIGRLSVPLYSGMRIPADAIEFATHQKRHPNQKAECSRCRTAYMKHSVNGGGLKTVIHTQLGWI